MKTYTTIETAREHAKKTNAKNIARIEHKVHGDVYICLLSDVDYFRNCLSRKPHADIVRVISGHDVLDEAARKEKAELEKNTITITLSSCGWGDFSDAIWTGDARRPNNDIIAECRTIMSRRDCDNPNISDIDIIRIIESARASVNNSKLQPKQHHVEEKHGRGYCYNCESYCYGDCGRFQPEPKYTISAHDTMDSVPY